MILQNLLIISYFDYNAPTFGVRGAISHFYVAFFFLIDYAVVMKIERYPFMLPSQSPEQKKILLAAVNASFVHSNPAIYALRRSALAYAENTAGTQSNSSSVFPQIEIAEYTINDRYEDILFDLIGRKPDVIGMSVYIWNAQICLSLLKDLRRLYPFGECILFAGGPEASTHPEAYLDSCDFVLTGEGEESFTRLCAILSDAEKTNFSGTGNGGFETLPGAVFRENGKMCYSSAGQSIPEMADLPFLYDGSEDFENRIVYYESSRGCPFRCTYCLSSAVAPVRFRDLDTVKKELQFFLDRNVSLVKFVDRTFNANAARAREIWTYIRDHDNRKTCFHFEIGADLLREEDLALLRSLRPGLIQLEIGIQSANPKTLSAIRRTADNEKIFHAVGTLAETQNMALHTDLIAGLPCEDFSSFAHSFDLVYALRAHQFQLGFLKVLSGTEMKQHEEEYGLISSSRPPYTVIATKWLTADEIDRLRGIADMVDLFWNSGLFRHALPYLEKLFDSAFAMYDALLDYYRREMGRKSLSPRARGDFLAAFAREAFPSEVSLEDIFTREVSPQKAFSQEMFEEWLRFDNRLHFHPSRRMTVEEIFGFPDPVRIRFDYTHMHPVTKEAAFTILPDPVS